MNNNINSMNNNVNNNTNNMKDNKSTFDISTIFIGILFILFLVLKLTHVIDWSWWWVTSPLWIGPAFVGLIVLLFFLVVFLKS